MSEEKRDFLGYLKSMVAMGASDLHVKVGAPPTYRVDGTLFPMDERSCTTADLQNLAETVLQPVRVFAHSITSPGAPLGPPAMAAIRSSLQQSASISD